MSYPIICIHATPRAIGPTTRMLNECPGEFAQDDILEPTLFELDPQSDEALDTFTRTIHRAEIRRPTAILTTCSMYTPHLLAVRRTIETALVGIDEAMIDRAAAIDGNLALVGSREESIALARRQIVAGAKRIGREARIMRTLGVASDACDTTKSTRQFAENLLDLSREVDAVIIVQVSLSLVSECLSADENERIMTSPRLALERLREVVGEHRR